MIFKSETWRCCLFCSLFACIASRLQTQCTRQALNLGRRLRQIRGKRQFVCDSSWIMAHFATRAKQICLKCWSRSYWDFWLWFMALLVNVSPIRGDTSRCRLRTDPRMNLTARFEWKQTNFLEPSQMIDWANVSHGELFIASSIFSGLVSFAPQTQTGNST